VMTVTAPGFATTKRENVVLQVSSPATLNLALEIQRGTVIIDVTGEAPIVNTTDATLGNNFNARQLTDLPSEGRDPAAILSLQPGVVYIGSSANQGVIPDQQNNDSRGGAVNGARSDQSNITLDGVDDNDQLEGYAFRGAVREPLDSLQEFRVTTSNYDCGVRMLGYNTQLSTPRVMQCSLRFAFSGQGMMNKARRGTSLFLWKVFVTDCLPQRRVAHTKSRTHVFRDQLDGGAVGDWIRLGQILHGLDQQALSVNVSGIGSSFSAFAAKFWRNRNGEDLGHEENPTSQGARPV
jgi:hypothetical protein